MNTNKEKKITIEVEDYYGTTVGAIQLNAQLINTDTSETGMLYIEDFTKDYIFDTNGDNIKVHLDGTVKLVSEIIHEDWEELLTGCCHNTDTTLFENEEDLIVVESYETEPYKMDKHEILHMLINNELHEYHQLASNCIQLVLNGDVEFLICPINATKKAKKWFKDIESLLG